MKRWDYRLLVVGFCLMTMGAILTYSALTDGVR